MTKSIVAAVVVLVSVAPAAAQRVRPVPPNLQLSGPATFKSNECVVTLTVENSRARPSGETSVVIDDRHRLTLRVLPRMSGGPPAITFVPHAFLCDGGSHKVELTWKGGRDTYETVFPRPGALRPFPAGLKPSPGNVK